MLSLVQTGLICCARVKILCIVHEKKKVQSLGEVCSGRRPQRPGPAFPAVPPAPRPTPSLRRAPRRPVPAFLARVGTWGNLARRPGSFGDSPRRACGARLGPPELRCADPALPLRHVQRGVLLQPRRLGPRVASVGRVEVEASRSLNSRQRISTLYYMIGDNTTSFILLYCTP